MFRRILDSFSEFFAGSSSAEPPDGVPAGGGDSRQSEEEAEPHEPEDVVVMPIEDSIDLHTFAPRDVASVVEEYLYEAQNKGFEEVRIIHGKGKGVQRRIVRGVLERHPAVESFRDASGSRGGWGATVAVLRRPR
jgi:dsDNA-specific endonuclease/ATPase MutS2